MTRVTIISDDDSKRLGIDDNVIINDKGSNE
jgi:hypothetical protein